MDTHQSCRPIGCCEAIVVVGVFAALLSAARSMAGESPPLELVRKIPLRGPAGRLDHAALDNAHSRLFVANMPNGSLDVVDLKTDTLVKQVEGQRGIQGIAYAADLNRIFVGNGEGGVCNAFDGQDYKLLKTFPLGSSDNVRYQSATHKVYVAHAENSLAVIDAVSLKVLKDIKLPGSPEAFQIEKARPRLYLNSPSAKQVVVIDTARQEVVGQYPLRLAEANFPMALDESTHRIYVGCRRDPMIVVLDSESGKELTSVPIPGDTDDVFFDARLKRLYASCGEGYLAVFQRDDAEHFQLISKLPTVKLARTCLFDANNDLLYLIVPRQPGKEGPEIWVYRSRP